MEWPPGTMFAVKPMVGASESFLNQVANQPTQPIRGCQGMSRLELKPFDSGRSVKSACSKRFFVLKLGLVVLKLLRKERQHNSKPSPCSKVQLGLHHWSAAGAKPGNEVDITLLVEHISKHCL